MPKNFTIPPPKNRANTVTEDYHKRSASVIRSRRWRALRLEALRRDGFGCIQCGARGRLEVDHIQPVRTRPDLAYSLENLQTLCPRCHSRKTRIEVGMGKPNPERDKWKKSIDRMMQKT